MSNRTCSVTNCERPVRARGFCMSHYDWHRDRGLLAKLPKPTLQERILSRIDIRDEGYETPCWISNRAAQPNGYTKIGINGATCLTHRVAYEAFVGAIPDGLDIDHLCRNAACCNPEHLEPVTPKVNMHRMNQALGIGVAATHCKWGHELSGDNVYLRPDRFGRVCKTCRRQRSMAHGLYERAPA